MKEETRPPLHAKQVMEVAINELALLLKQRKAISKRVRVVKRTVEGLAALFGDEAPDIRHENIKTPHVKSPQRGQVGPPTITARLPVNSDAGKPKLERACRIALLESEKPATSGEIYDRITRRGSYHLSRYKHPLMRVIATLDLLVQQGEVRTLVDGDCRRWQWNSQETDGNREPPAFLSEATIQSD
jgi:hypothetical protein